MKACIPCLTLHHTGRGDYIGRLSIPEFFDEKNEVPTRQTPSQIFFILDRSGSMGQWVERIANIIIPELAMKYLGMSSNDKLTLITFDSSIEKVETTVEGIQGLNIRSRGCTYMKGVFDALLTSVDVNNPSIKIVAISDGQIWDKDQTIQQAQFAATQLKQNYSISVTAVRLFTSSSQPDTTALASILQLNTAAPGCLIDIRANPNKLQEIVEEIGMSQGFATASTSAFTLSCEDKLMRHSPWTDPVSKLHFNTPKGNSSMSFWFDEKPSSLLLNDAPIAIKEGKPVTIDSLSFLLGDKIDHFLRHLRVLMVLNSAAAKEELNSIVNYFKELEDNLAVSEDLKPLLADGSLSGRAAYMKASLSRQMKSVSHTMQAITNDEKVAKLNLAQQADYLRQAGSASDNRTARGFARRAVASGVDFDSVVRAEIFSMAAHADELKSVDDSGHSLSFYSQATTLEGIKCMIELAKEPDILNNLSAAQLLRLFNIVGIPAVGPIGDFPDPMTYRLDKFLPGTYISVADITMAMHQGGKLIVPGGKDEIKTSIPFFESNSIQKFLQKYARSSLEYVCSIGMRRMIAEVPKTYPYTICAGLWRMVEELDNSKTEIAMKHFIQLAKTYEMATGGYFDYLLPLLQDNQDPEFSYYLAHNGITNLLGPFLCLLRSQKTEYFDRILRALYSFEAYQVCRRLFRDDGAVGRTKALDELLGIDFSSSRATPLPPKFTRTEQNHCKEAVVDTDLVQKYSKNLWFVHYVTLVPQFFEALVKANGEDDCMNRLKAVPTMSESSIRTALNLPSTMSLEDFMLYNVVEGILHSTKQERIDKETNKPLLKDLGNPTVGSEMIADYVQSRYEKDYEDRLQLQLGEEKSILRAELIDQLLKATDIETFVSLVAAGNARGVVSVTIDRNNSVGFDRLHNALLNIDVDVTHRVEKLRVIYTGLSPSGEAAFNGGNLLRTDWKPLGDFLKKLGRAEVWDEIQEELRTRGHLYRGGEAEKNRHGHSNDKPSYFAFGCETLQEYHHMVAKEIWSTYIETHCECCGVREYLAKQF